MPDLGTTPSSQSTAAVAETSADQKAAKRGAMMTVFLVMVIDLLGFAIVLPLLPRYGKEFLEPLFPGAQNGSLRGGILGLVMASFSLMQFIFAPIWGRMSDRHGRKPFLIMGLVGSVVFYGLFGFASQWGRDDGRQMLGLVLIFVARIGAGIAGATVSTAQAVIADCTTPEERSRGMALIGAAFGIGFFFGPLLGFGALYFVPENHGSPGYAASILSLVALLIGLIKMPESWRPDSVAGRRNWFNLDGIRLAMQTPTVGALILLFFLATLAFATFEPTLALLTEDVLQYGDRNNFLVFAYVGFVLALAQGVLYRRLARRGVQELTFMQVGGVLMCLGLGSIGGIAAWATSGSVSSSVLLIPVLLALAVAVTGFAFMTPSVQSLISRRSDPSKQGEILGVNQSANAMSRILGPMFGVSLYYIKPSGVLPYVFSVALLLFVLFLIGKVRRSPAV